MALQFRKLRKLIGLLVIITILSILIMQIRENWATLYSRGINPNWVFILLAFFIHLFVYPLASTGWWLILTKNGEKITWLDSNRSFIMSNLGRYIPGKVWQFVGRVNFFENLGVSKLNTTFYMGLELILMLASSVIVFLVAILLSPSLEWEVIGGVRIISFLAIISCFVILHPSILRIVLAAVEKITQKQMLANIKLNYLYSFKLICLYSGTWLIRGIALALMIQAFVDISCSDIIFYSGVYSISYFIGYVSIFSPGGLGVREGIMTICLNLMHQAGFGAIISILARIIVSLCEVTYVMLTMALLYRKEAMKFFTFFQFRSCRNNTNRRRKVIQYKILSSSKALKMRDNLDKRK